MADRRSAKKVVVVGTGAAGLSAALRAHDLGLEVTLIEASDKVGGSTSFSGGQVWAGVNHVMAREGIEDSFDDTRAYVRAIGEDPTALDEETFDQWVSESPRVLEDLERRGDVTWQIVHGLSDYRYPDTVGSTAQGRYLSGAPLRGSELGARRGDLLVSPHHPPGPTYDELFALGGDPGKTAALRAERRAEDVLTFGTGLVAHLLRAVDRRGIPILLQHRGRELVTADGAVTGVVCERPEGGSITLDGAVILASGTYDWNMAMVKEFSQLDADESGSVAPPTIRGDGIAMARGAGAHIFQMPVGKALHVPGYLAADPQGPYDLGYRDCLQLSLPHSMMVDSRAQRFCDDSYYRAISEAVATNSISKPYFLVWDEQHHQNYGLNPAGPGQDYPEKMGVVSAPTLADLATALGLPPVTFTESAARFNRFAEAGVDEDFGRGTNSWVTTFLGDPRHKPNPVLGPLERAPFYGMQMRLLGTGVGAAGVHTGKNGRALAPDGDPIPGLYAVGVVSAPTANGTGYNSGFSIGRGIVFGYLAAEHLHSSAG